MRINLRILTGLVFTAVFVLFFQNCSQNYGLGLGGQSTSEKASAEVMPNNSDGSVSDQSDNSSCCNDDGDIGKEIESCDHDDDSYRNVCDKLVKKSIEVKDGLCVSNQRGNVYIKGDQIGSCDNIYGNVHILGLKDNSSVAEIKDSRGNHILCGVSVKKLSQIRGNVIVVGGDVGDIDDMRGNLRVIDGKVLGKITNSVGNVRQ